ncbi:hypothetical protein ASPACDRAFT_75051 [Aspergillus aculeatus ATCC 16872]|uniref:Xylanolytic transcriptional activator regulatory domain-containing protein n=1 Tax=Aspergillus aculeatus (strain ATCC 16872 / CBS 172.66 / WB 5094) TaxID=690307 RepID=A0A1L9X574_ASPA1|nr:uncharacterized protein ASPACDRAFT_75051 [Aspergillus aculeatus ATCC 16872]OJK03474.1 hypothetical protein ASPACDRAFT_75051 [Aspergillus aculeatus ATCC 16872]
MVRSTLSYLITPSPALSVSQPWSLGGMILPALGSQTDISLGAQPHIDQALPLPGLLLLKGTFNTKFLGLSSVGTTISTCLKYSASESASVLEAKSIDHLVQGIRHLDEFTMSEPVSANVDRLPSMDIADKGITAYIENVHLRYAIVGMQHLEIWRDTYSDKTLMKDPVTFSRLCLLTTIGLLSMPHKQGCDSTSPWAKEIHSIYEGAWSLLTAVLASPYIDAVELLLLHTLHLLYSGKLGIVWVNCGLVIRVAQSLGLHRNSPIQLGLSEEQIQRRARLWEVSYALDAFLSLSEGRPPAITEQHADGVLLSLSLGPGTFPVKRPVGTIHTWHVHLAIIANRLSPLLNRVEAGSWLLEYLSMLDRDLIKWRDAIPIECRPEEENLAKAELYTAVSWLHLQYFNLMRTIHWVSFVISAQYTNQSSILGQYGPRIRSSETICLTAARSLVVTLNNAISAPGYIGRFTGIPISYCMAAISVIFRKIHKQLDIVSARTNLEFLRAGTLHILQSLTAAGSVEHVRALFADLQRVAENAINRVSAATA